MLLAFLWVKQKTNCSEKERFTNGRFHGFASLPSSLQWEGNINQLSLATKSSFSLLMIWSLVILNLTFPCILMLKDTQGFKYFQDAETVL